MKTEEAATAVAGIASKTTYGGAGITVYGFLLTNEFAVFVGILAAVGGLVVNWYYKRQANQRAEELHSLRRDYIQRGRRTDTDLMPLGDDD
jgi:hypothetical protein